MTTQKDWSKLEDEEDKMRPHHETQKVTRPIEKTLPDGTVQKVDQVFVVKKWLYPVRKEVKERKKMTKFGEVKGLPKGVHKPGDFQEEQPIQIETTEDNAELNVVKQLQNIDTDTMRMNREMKKLVDMETVPTKKSGKEDKYSTMFKNAGKGGYSIKVSNVMAYEQSMEDIDKALNEFFNALFSKANIRYPKVKLVKTKDKEPRFLNRCFLTFVEEGHAQAAFKLLEIAEYNDAFLEVEWAEAEAPRRK